MTSTARQSSIVVIVVTVTPCEQSLFYLLLALSVQSICTVRKGSTCRVSLLYDRTLRQLPVIGICVIREELWDCQGQTLRVARRKSIISEKLFGR